jgi:hypothetical protein
LVEADESIMAMIKKINNDYGNSIILEDLGDKACLVKEDKLAFLENKVKAVCFLPSYQEHLDDCLTWSRPSKKKFPIQKIPMTKHDQNHHHFTSTQLPTNLNKNYLRTHPLQLLCSFHLRHPRNPMLSKQLCPRFRPIKSSNIIHNTHLNNNTPLKGLPLPENSRSTVWTEVAGYRVTTISCFGDFFGGALDFEAVGLDDDVGAVGAA